MTGEPVDRSFVLEGPADPGQIDAVHGLVARAAAAHPELAPDDVMLFETALIEIANNVVRYGGETGTVRWRIVLYVHEEEITAELEDTGKEFVPERGKTMPGEEAEGGRGLPIAEALLDRIDFAREDGRNRWTLARRLGRTGNQDRRRQPG